MCSVQHAVYVIISFSASFGLLCFLFLFFASLIQDEMQRNGWKKKRREIGPTKRELHELPYIEMIKSGTIRLASEIDIERS